MTQRTVLILGGYGTFGGRLAQLLAPDARLNLVLAGRSEVRARACLSRLPPGAGRSALRLDRNDSPAPVIAGLRPWLVVDATGPFQLYGANPYAVVEAAIAAGANYLDLADGSDFVRGIARFEEKAREAGVFVLSGASSFPVLTAAIARHLGNDLARLDTITGGIAPSPYAGIGLNVVRALLSYAGKPIKLVRAGAPAIGYALTETRRATIAPPGALPLDNLHFSLVDVPDLTLVPDAIPTLQTVWLGAGPVPAIWHLMLNGLNWLVRWRLLPSLSPFAPLCHWFINHLSWGAHRGGMFIALTGLDHGGRRVRRSWHLIAEGEDGPFIPAMAVAAVIAKALDGAPPRPGARPATTGIELADYERIFAGRAITHGRRDEDIDGNTPLYRRILGEAYDGLPASLRSLHDLDTELTATGLVDIEHGHGLLAPMVRTAMGFPDVGTAVPVTVHLQRRDGIETWERDFAGRRFRSTQQPGAGRDQHLIVERFGALSVSLAIVVEGGRLRLVVRRWSLFGIRLPRVLAPGGDTYEYEQDGRFHFHIELRHPFIGLIVRYRGWLELTGAER